MKNIIKQSIKGMLAWIVFSGGVAMAASGEDETFDNLTLEKRLYQYDGFGAQWALDTGSDGLWFVPKGDIEGSYSAPLKIRNSAAPDTLVIGTNNGNGSSAANGYVGMGMSTPLEKVDVEARESAARLQLTSKTDSVNEAAQFIQRRARLSGGAGSRGHGLKSGDNIGLFSFRGHYGSGFTASQAVISVAATEEWDSGSNGNQISFRHTPNGTSTMVTALQIKGDGDVYIPNGDLYVEGSKMNVPDYVFDENYNLMPLDELKAYVQKNNHLPGVVSADEVDKAGIVNLSGLQMTLLEKVEELTLYTLQQEEVLAETKAKLEAKDAKISMMETRQRVQDERIGKLESIFASLALESSTK